LRVPHKSNFFFFCNDLFWLASWPIAIKSWNYGGSPKIEDSIERWSASPFGHLYRWEGKDFEQNIWDWSEVLLGTPLGNNIGNLGNILRTSREHVGNKGKMKKILPPSPPPKKLKRKQIKARWVHASAYPLAACICGFQNCWSPFLA